MEELHPAWLCDLEGDIILQGWDVPSCTCKRSHKSEEWNNDAVKQLFHILNLFKTPKQIKMKN